ncbi:MAG: lysozyme inhibitor LprI family protein [Bradyrhizobium sp.]
MAIQLGLQLGPGLPAHAQNSPAALPLFEKNHCIGVKDAADQLFCANPELNTIATRLNAAIRNRLDRLSDSRLAIVENAEWVRNRNSSCGIFQNVPTVAFNAVRECLLKETEERIAILNDPNFDCLAADTAARALICKKPSLALAEADLNNQADALVGKLKEDQAKDALAEYARWIRSRDRKCGLAGRENVPLEDLSSSEACLAEQMSAKKIEFLAAESDPTRVFGRQQVSLAPDADAVDLCVAQIHSANGCGAFLSVTRIIPVNSRISEQSASVLADVEMVVLSPFAACSPIASACTGSCWDLQSGQAKPSPGSRASFPVAQRVRIKKSFAFQKAGVSWRCGSTALQPIELGVTAKTFSH